MGLQREHETIVQLALSTSDVKGSRHLFSHSGQRQKPDLIFFEDLQKLFSGFLTQTGTAEKRQLAVLALQRLAEEAAGGEHQLSEGLDFPSFLRLMHRLVTENWCVSKDGCEIMTAEVEPAVVTEGPAASSHQRSLSSSNSRMRQKMSPCDAATVVASEY